MGDKKFFPYLLPVRCILFLIAFLLISLISKQPYTAISKWWTLIAVLGNIFTIAILYLFCRRKCITYKKLINYEKSKTKIGAAILIVFLIIAVGMCGLYVVLLALIVYVGITNVYNFMDGINGITAGYSLAVLVPLMLLNGTGEFVEPALIVVTLLSVLVFCFFNFRPKGKAKCFAGDVGSIGIAFIILFVLGRVIVETRDVTYLLLLVVYGDRKSVV